MTDQRNGERTFLDETILSRRWKLSPRTLQRFRYEGKPPRFYRVSGRVLYLLSDIEEFEANCLVDRQTF